MVNGFLKFKEKFQGYENQYVIIGGTACLIPFKAKAWLDLKERKSSGEQVDSKNIKKHKNDVFRLAQLITVNTRQALNPEIEEVDLKSLGIKGTDSKKNNRNVISVLRFERLLI